MEKSATYLKVSPSKMGVKGSLKVWHRVMAVSKSPARTRRATISSDVELPVGKGGWQQGGGEPGQHKQDEENTSPSPTPVLTAA